MSTDDLVVSASHKRFCASTILGNPEFHEQSRPFYLLLAKKYLKYSHTRRRDFFFHMQCIPKNRENASNNVQIEIKSAAASVPALRTSPKRTPALARTREEALSLFRPAWGHTAGRKHKQFDNSVSAYSSGNSISNVFSRVVRQQTLTRCPCCSNSVIDVHHTQVIAFAVPSFFDTQH